MTMDTTSALTLAPVDTGPSPHDPASGDPIRGVIGLLVVLSYSYLLVRGFFAMNRLLARLGVRGSSRDELDQMLESFGNPAMVEERKRYGFDN